MKTRNWIIVGALVAAALLATADGTITTQDGGLLLNPANGKIGIGTSPQSALTIPHNGSIGFKKWAHYPNTVYASIGTNSYTLAYNSWGADYGYNIMHDFQTGGTSRLVIQNNGNVGIGTASPSARVDIVAGSSVPLAVSSTQTKDAGIRYSLGPDTAVSGTWVRENSMKVVADRGQLSDDGVLQVIDSSSTSNYCSGWGYVGMPYYGTFAVFEFHDGSVTLLHSNGASNTDEDGKLCIIGKPQGSPHGSTKIMIKNRMGGTLRLHYWITYGCWNT